ncbi:MAG: hypothetical protein CM15mP129_06650 [Chloroflexota bacterium]|nr:MAG: hypothetical protein CM15mP129_06650 [Chloroflexota bacterium]
MKKNFPEKKIFLNKRKLNFMSEKLKGNFYPKKEILFLKINNEMIATSFCIS